ncbi:hypothetical protein V3C99_005273 [Haemonchus contortus]
MASSYVEYVAQDDVLADISLKSFASVDLRTSNTILLALLLLNSFVLNVILMCTIYASRKLRSLLIYLMFCHIAIINIVDLILAALTSLLNIANGILVLGEKWCRVEAIVQEFCQLYMLMTITLIVVERATQFLPYFPIKMLQRIGGWTLTKRQVLGLSLVLLLASFAAAIPISAEMLFMKSFKVRYVCEVGSGTSVIYTVARVLIYAGCLSIILVCALVIFGKREGCSLPQQLHDYSDFINRNRARQESLSRAKLGVLLACIFILVEGPYIMLCFALEISYSLLSGGGFGIPQDVDTFITWLKFLFPILSPITILCWCSDISASVKELFLCRSYDPPMIGPNVSGYRGMGAAKGFVTLVATTDGLPLKLRTSRPASTMANFSSQPMTSPS